MALIQQYITTQLQQQEQQAEKQPIRRKGGMSQQHHSQTNLQRNRQQPSNNIEIVQTWKNKQEQQKSKGDRIRYPNQIMNSSIAKFSQDTPSPSIHKMNSMHQQLNKQLQNHVLQMEGIIASSNTVLSHQNQTQTMITNPVKSALNAYCPSQKQFKGYRIKKHEGSTPVLAGKHMNLTAGGRKTFNDLDSSGKGQTFKITQSGRLLEDETGGDVSLLYSDLKNAEPHIGLDRDLVNIAENESQDTRDIIKSNTTSVKPSAIRKKNNQYHLERQGANTKDQYLATSPQILHTDMLFMGDKALKDPRDSAQKNAEQDVSVALDSKQSFAFRSQAQQILSHHENDGHLAQVGIKAGEMQSDGLQPFQVGNFKSEQCSNIELIEMSNEDQQLQSKDESFNPLNSLSINNYYQHHRRIAPKHTAPIIQTTSKPSPGQTISKQVFKDSLNTESNLSNQNSFAAMTTGQNRSQTPSRKQNSRGNQQFPMLPSIHPQQPSITHQTAVLPKNHSLCDILYQSQTGGKPTAIITLKNSSTQHLNNSQDSKLPAATFKHSLTQNQPSEERILESSADLKGINSKDGKHKLYQDAKLKSFQRIVQQDGGNGATKTIQVQEGGKSVSGRDKIYSSTATDNLKDKGQVLGPVSPSKKKTFLSNIDKHDVNSERQKQLLHAYHDKEESPEIARLYHDTLLNKLIDHDTRYMSRASNQSQSKTVAQNNSQLYAGYNTSSKSGVTIRMNQKSEQTSAQHLKRDSFLASHSNANRQRTLHSHENNVKMFKKIITQKNSSGHFGSNGQQHQLNQNQGTKSQTNFIRQQSRKRLTKDTKSQAAAYRYNAQSNHQSGRNQYQGGPASPRSRTAEFDGGENALRSNSGIQGGNSVGPEKEKSGNAAGSGMGPNVSTHSHQHQHHHYHIDLNIQQVNNILINYGIMPMSYDRPAGNAGPSGQTTGGRAAGHSSTSYGMNRSQVYGSKTNLKGKEQSFMNRSNVHSQQPKGNRYNNSGVHTQSQHIAIRPIINQLACRQIYLGNQSFVDQQHQQQMQAQTTKKSKRYTQHTSIKLQNKMKSRHDKLQSQVQNLCQTGVQGSQGQPGHHLVYASDLPLSSTSPQALHKTTSLDLLSSIPPTSMPPQQLLVQSAAHNQQRLAGGQQRMLQPYDHFERANLGAAIPPDLNGYLQIDERDVSEAAVDDMLERRRGTDIARVPEETCASPSDEMIDYLKAPKVGSEKKANESEEAAAKGGSRNGSYQRKGSSKGSKLSNSKIERRDGQRESSGKQRLKYSAHRTAKKDQSFSDAVVVNAVQDKIKSLTMGRRQMQLSSSDLKKRRESNQMRGTEKYRKGNNSKSFKDGACSPPNDLNSRENNFSEIKILYESCLKTQDPNSNADAALLPQSMDLSMKNKNISGLQGSNSKFVRPSVVSRERSYANVLKNQEQKIRQIDKQSKRTNIIMEHFTEGGMMSSNIQRLVSQAASEQYATNHQNPSRSRPQNEYFTEKSHKESSKHHGNNILGPKPQISDFEIFELIGTGNFGRVCKAYNNKLQRVSALKIIKKESIIAMKQVDHVIGEREVLKYLTLQHANERAGHGPKSHSCPFIISIYSSFQDEAHLYLELEYVEGCTLLSQINKRNEDVTSNMPFYAGEALLTLEFLHNQNIIYRDLKPENIVLSMRERGHMKLVDFGFARQLKYYGQKCLTNCGTPQYIAPEIIRGAGHSFEVDVWCLGVLIVDLVSGQTPFQAENTKLSYEKIILCQPSFPRQVTQNQRDLLNRIFVSDPSMRITLQEIKTHPVFKEFNFERTMNDLYLNDVAPFIPQSALFNEIALRTSSDTQMQKANKQNKLLAGMFKKSPEKDGGGLQARQLSFDNEHFQKFLKQDKRDKLLESKKDAAIGPRAEDQSPKRKRQNPLGDFKFKKIDEYF